jgi:micrococcal nuclease
MRRIVLAALAVAFLAAPAAAQAPTEGPWRLVDVRDGDTVILGTNAGFVTGIKIRLYGLDAPETKGRCPEETAAAAAATQRLRELVSRRVRVVSYLETDAYGRLLARLYDRDGRDVSEVLIAEGHARPLGGNERRQPWCAAPTGG